MMNKLVKIIFLIFIIGILINCNLKPTIPSILATSKLIDVYYLSNNSMVLKFEYGGVIKIQEKNFIPGIPVIGKIYIIQEYDSEIKIGLADLKTTLAYGKLF